MTQDPGAFPRARRTSTILADGRELIYFDDSEPYRNGARRRDVADERPLGVRTPSGTMRLDALTGDWVSIAGHRQNRTFLPPADECPLCRWPAMETQSPVSASRRIVPDAVRTPSGRSSATSRRLAPLR